MARTLGIALLLFFLFPLSVTGEEPAPKPAPETIPGAVQPPAAEPAAKAPPTAAGETVPVKEPQPEPAPGEVPAAAGEPTPGTDLDLRESGEQPPPGISEKAGASPPEDGSGAPGDVKPGEVKIENVTDFSQVGLEGLQALLEVKVVTASKREETLEEAPSIVTVFTREEIDRIGARRLIDILRLTPSFVEVSAPMERNVASRGVHASTAQNVVVLIDGLRMNDFLTNTAAPDWFILDIAEQVEIIRGPGAALYGSNALTGVVNIITRDPAKGPRFLAEVGYGLNDSLHLLVQKAERFEDGSKLFLSGTFMQSLGTLARVPGSEDVLLPKLGQNVADGIQEGENLTYPSPTTPVWANRYGPSFEGLLKFERPEDWAIRANFALKEFYPPRSETGSLMDVASQSQRPVRSDARATLDFSKSWGDEADSGKLTLRPVVQYYSHDQRSQEIAEQFFEGAAENQRTAILNWAGEELRLRILADYARSWKTLAFVDDFSVIGGLQAEYNVGYDYELTYCQPDRDHAYGPSVYSEEKTGNDYVCFRGASFLDEGSAVDKWANRIYLEKNFLGNGDDWVFGSFLQVGGRLPGDISVTLGGRVDYNPDYLPVFTPRIALVKALSQEIYLKALYSSSFVYPPFLYRTGNRQAGIIGNPDMVPEAMKTAEFLIGFKTSWFRAELNGYYNQVTDFITFDSRRLANTRQYFYDNYGHLHIVGAEGTFTLSLLEGRLSGSINAGFTWPLGQTDDMFLLDGELGGPSRYPPYLGTVSLDGRPWEALTVHVSATYVARSKFEIGVGNWFKNVAGGGGETYSSKSPDDYDTSSFVLSANLIYSFLDNWRATLTATNILGSAYHMTGATTVPYVIEGRQVVFNLGCSY